GSGAVAGVASIFEEGGALCIVGQTIAFCGMSWLAKARQNERRHKTIVCPITRQGAAVNVTRTECGGILVTVGLTWVSGWPFSFRNSSTIPCPVSTHRGVEGR